MIVLPFDRQPELRPETGSSSSSSRTRTPLPGGSMLHLLHLLLFCVLFCFLHAVFFFAYSASAGKRPRRSQAAAAVVVLHHQLLLLWLLSHLVSPFGSTTCGVRWHMRATPYPFSRELIRVHSLVALSTILYMYTLNRLRPYRGFLGVLLPMTGFSLPLLRIAILLFLFLFRRIADFLKIVQGMY